MAQFSEDQKPMPRHIGIIMDGNGRWAKKRGLPRLAGHKSGAENFKRIADLLLERDIEVSTFYAFSTENWKRPQDEVEHIMSLLVHYLEDWFHTSKDRNMRLKFIGDRSVFSPKIRELMDRVEKASEHYRNCLNLALNYGARDEIARACTLLAQEGKTEITPEDVSAHLYTAGQPDVDLVIRTGGEARLSNFLLFQSAYAEFYFTDRLWPDFSSEDLDQAIDYFRRRERRFGGILERK